MEKPKRLENIELESLISECEGYLEFVDSDDYHEDNDYDHYIFKQAMKTVFGKDVFKYINNKLC